MSNVTSINEAMKPRSWNRLRWDWQSAVLASEGLPDRSKLVACVLVSQFAHHESAQCCPGLSALAKALSVSTDTVKRALRSLEDEGWITRGGGEGRGYKLTISFHFRSNTKGGNTAPLKDGKECSSALLSSAERGAVLHEKGCRSARPPRPPYKDKPIFNQKSARLPARGARPTDLSAFVRIGEWTEGEWDQWLSQQGFPPLSAIGKRITVAENEGWDLPFRVPPRPDDERAAGVALRFAQWLQDERGLKDGL